MYKCALHHSQTCVHEDFIICSISRDVCVYCVSNLYLTDVWLPYLALNTTSGVTTLLVPAYDDGSTAPIPVPTGFPIGNTIQHSAYVSYQAKTNNCTQYSPFLQIGTNGIISFQQPFFHHLPYLFPSEFTYISSAFVLAPFWSDVDITYAGSIKYEVHNHSNNSFLSQVSTFISNYTGSEFEGTWLLVAQWEQVPPHPGQHSTVVSSFSPSSIVCHYVLLS